MSVSLELVVNARATVGEGPLWEVERGVLWWTDIKGRVVHRYDPRRGEDVPFPMPLRVGTMALRRDGGFVLAAEHGFWFWNPDTGTLDHVLDVEADRPDNRMNDGGCDRQGRFVVASMNLAAEKAPTAACWRLDASLRAERLADGLTVGNGIAFSPAGDRFYLSDTLARVVRAHSYGGADIGPPEPFGDLATLPGMPDGGTVDEEGFYWTAGVYGGQLYRFAPDGRLDRVVDVPVVTPTCPCFGGPDLADLYVTSMGENRDAPCGGLFVVRNLGVRGLPEPRFAG